MMQLQEYLSQCAHLKTTPLLKTGVQAALAAGEIIRPLFGNIKDVRHKGRIDIVTEADIASEEKIIEVLQSAGPGIRIVSEETNPSYDALCKGPSWIIDPLDGTTNFAHGFPWFGISIALAEGDKILTGVIYCPLQDELFCACLGGGAWLNGQAIRVSRTPCLEDALLATGFPYDIREDPEGVVGALKAIIIKAQGIRRAGAAALDLAYVACGRLDGFWEIKLRPWDTAAGKLLIEEAGGRVSVFDGRPYSPVDAEILATNTLIHPELSVVLKDFSGREKGVTHEHVP
ncbi:MAG: inositol monophosphatase family protein [Desulfobacteraceae bacterium]|nr:inositol monophosphatase family protein [Desulfobacteraceae bacterium]